MLIHLRVSGLPPLRAALIIACGVSIVSLAAALISQYGFNLHPCKLCIIQRIPYAMIIAFALVGLWKPAWSKLLVLGSMLAFLVGSGVGFYHAAVEKKWIAGPSSCTFSTDDAFLSVEAILQKIQTAPIVSCDTPAWEFAGLTMASMNGIWSLMLTIIMGLALRCHSKKVSCHA